MLEGNSDLTRPVFALLLIVAALLQSALLPRWQILAVTPGLVVVLLLGWSAYRGVAEALVWVFVAGFLLDVLGLDRLGANALALLPVALFGGFSRGRFFHSAFVFPMVAGDDCHVCLRGNVARPARTPRRRRRCGSNVGASDATAGTIECVAGAPGVRVYRVVAADGA